jgi:hypothetical protein
MDPKFFVWTNKFLLIHKSLWWITPLANSSSSPQLYVWLSCCYLGLDLSCYALLHQVLYIGESSTRFMSPLTSLFSTFEQMICTPMLPESLMWCITMGTTLRIAVHQNAIIYKHVILTVKNFEKKIC